MTARAGVVTEAAKTRARAHSSEAQSGLGRGLTAGRASIAEMGPGQCCGLRAGEREARLTRARDGGNGGSDQGLVRARQVQVAVEARVTQGFAMGGRI